MSNGTRTETIRATVDELLTRRERALQEEGSAYKGALRSMTANAWAHGIAQVIAVVVEATPAEELQAEYATKYAAQMAETEPTVLGAVNDAWLYGVEEAAGVAGIALGEPAV